jgi:polysaccharide biosynthesis protein PslH
LKIVFVLSRFPWPLEKGDKLRAFHFLRLLSQHHEIHLFALSDRQIGKGETDALDPYCTTMEVAHLSRLNILNGLIWAFRRRLPFQVGYFYHPGAVKQLKKFIDVVQPDLLFCQLVRVAPYTETIQIRKILDYQDALSLNMMRRSDNSTLISRLVFRREAKLLRRYEQKVKSEYDHLMVISAPDKDAIDHHDNTYIEIIPNGVDYRYFSPDDGTPGTPGTPGTHGTHEILFTGNMSYAPNIDGAIWLAKEILPMVRKVIPGANLLLAGSSPSREVKALSGAGITISGWMPDIRDAYRSGSVFVAPMRTGSGLQNKLLEAMAMKLPCITTTLANGSLNAKDQHEVIVADSSREIADAIIRLLKNPEEAKRIAEQGHHMVKSRFCWDTIGRQLEDMIHTKA